jgi:predicted DCC family thiol-disulfide oxidoreductase YuxK
VNHVPILVYDGDCAFCSASVRFGRRLLRTSARWEPWQFLDLAALGITAEQAREAVQWVAPDGSVSAGPVAIAELLRSSGRGWAVAGWILRRPPVVWLAWPAYRLIARNRHRLPGGTPACAVRTT